MPLMFSRAVRISMPRPSMFAIALLAAMLSVPATAQTKAKEPADATVTGEIGLALDHYLTSPKRFADGFSGCALVAKKGELLLEKGYGVADVERKVAMRADMLWDWCSVSKQFTSAAVLRLEMQKKLSIDDSLKKFFPKITADKSKITLRQLMNHTSGLASTGDLPHDNSVFDRETMVKAILALPMVSEPGKKWVYNNIAYFLLAAILEKVSGQPFERFVGEQLFKPAKLVDAHIVGDAKLDMKRVPRDERGTGQQFEYGERLSWGYRGAGGFVMACRDMLRWHQALQGDAVLNDAEKKKYYEVGLNDYALGWEVTKGSGRLIYAHSGRTGEIITYYLRQMDDDIVVAIAFNYVPKDDPSITARDLEMIARTGRPLPAH